MHALAIILAAPQRIELRPLPLAPVAEGDVLVEIAWSGISTGTEKLLWSGAMPPFPGMGYPLVPGYESVGRVVDAGSLARERIGEWVFVPGANCFVGAHALFGGSAERVVLPSARALRIDPAIGERGVLLALAATAHHAVIGGQLPELVIGHGILGRLIARLVVALGDRPPIVWETNPTRRAGAEGYAVIDPNLDLRRDYATICDASGAGSQLDAWISRLARGGEIVLAGFYDKLSFAYPHAFMREARLRIAAEFTPEDSRAVIALVEAGALSLDGLVSHVRPASEAVDAYATAFQDPECVKMVLDWRSAK
ncbi:MAG: chlorophyll synthesis pathway protein BchC [Proteobacteria bacterium SG_bin5]|nr:chlorophyll synthesis pathway protein BchC [Sphingomonas sp.]OQW43776.1 MAG: chlorophyll synthesis pathway protein BchC [Proteobacteria bacterium SG_bin5]